MSELFIWEAGGAVLRKEPWPLLGVDAASQLVISETWASDFTLELG